MSKERPILFSGPMVRSILDGSKTQTRRVVKWPIYSKSDGGKKRIFGKDDVHTVTDLLSGNHRHPLRKIPCPYGAPDDLLYVRETSFQEPPYKGNYKDIIHYRASATEADEEWFKEMGWKWRPSIFMPKKYARIWLRVKDRRIERLQEISEVDARAEGVKTDIIPASGDHPRLECYVTVPDDNHAYVSAKEAFANLWDSINSKRGYSWESDPYVWVVEFERTEKP